jgi:hypothetical protein
MRHDKKIAINLRKTGQSYLQISQALDVPKSTLSYWLKNIKISNRAQEKISKRAYFKSVEALIKRNKNQTVVADLKAQAILKESTAEAKRLVNDKLFVAGVSLYWAEGYKKGAYGSKYKSVDFTNSDPEMIKIMMKFFRKFCKINEDKFKLLLMAHPNINIDKTISFWSDITKLPRSQFTKTQTAISKSSKFKRPINSLLHGTIHIRVYDVVMFYKVIGWINGLKNTLI